MEVICLAAYNDTNNARSNQQFGTGTLPSWMFYSVSVVATFNLIGPVSKSPLFAEIGFDLAKPARILFKSVGVCEVRGLPARENAEFKRRPQSSNIERCKSTKTVWKPETLTSECGGLYLQLYRPLFVFTSIFSLHSFSCRVAGGGSGQVINKSI